MGQLVSHYSEGAGLCETPRGHHVNGVNPLPIALLTLPQPMTKPKVTPRLYTPSVLLAHQVMVLAMHG